MADVFISYANEDRERARSVVVLWSAQSTASEWVSEAALAAERGVLVPVFIERVKPPLEFRRRQTIDLIGWSGDPDPYAASVVEELPDGRLVVGLGDGAIEVWRGR